MVLPNLRFFEPVDGFMEWFIKELSKCGRSRSIIEIGAGQGHLSRMIADAGLNVMAIDLHEREETVFPVLPADATDFTHYPCNGTVIIARPNKGFWIADSINQALTAGSEVYYIAKPDRINDDLGDVIGDTMVMKMNVGAENEDIIRITRKKVKKMTEFHLITWGHGHCVQGPAWMRLIDNKWTGQSGGGFYKGDGKEPEVIIETVEAESWEDLDYTKTSLVVGHEKRTSGWLDPKGKFYPCRTRDHDEYCYMIFKREIQELEDEGWARLGGIREHMNDYSDYRCLKQLTPEQRNKLSRIGYIVEETD
jgi:hypothetical protein